MATRKRKEKRASSNHSPVPVVPKLPLLWTFNTGKQAVGLAVHGQHVWLANDDGAVFVLARDGTMQRTLKLPKPVHCLLIDDVWKYAGCNDGKVYDLAARTPHPLYVLSTDMSIGWLEAFEGKLCVADAEGGLTIFDVDGSTVWEKRDDVAGECWMVRADSSRIYLGCKIGLFAYEWSGAKRWHVPEVTDVRFGVMFGDELVVTAGWRTTKRSTLHVVTKAGRVRVSMKLKPGPGGAKHNGAESCAAERDPSSGDVRLFASCAGTLFCFGHNGQALWQAPMACGSACNMQIADGLMYVVTTDGHAACIDVRPAAIEAARAGALPETRVIDPKSAPL